jgi:RNA polymerase sigma-70 factor, ECF subfamily
LTSAKGPDLAEAILLGGLMADERIQQPKKRARTGSLRVVEGRTGFPDSRVREALDSTEALGELCDYYAPRIYSFVLKRVGRVEDAEDLTSVVFEKVILKLDSFDEAKASFSTWIYRIALNCVTDFYRSRSRKRETCLEDAAVTDRQDRISDLERMDLHIALLDLMEQLPAKYKEAVTLRYFADMRVLEVAQTLGITESAASKRILRGLEELRMRSAGGPLEELL